MTYTLAPSDPSYPVLLREIPDPPPILYVKAPTLNVFATRTIAVVGTRHMTTYGEAITRKLVTDLVARGFTIVSGLAWGIDTVAHRTAIESGGKTIAVLGCGIDIIWPPSNARLYSQIARESGAIVSELSGHTRPNKEQFKRRNRIISGLSMGVVVIEGKETSGSLITARYAAEQGRDVFAVPGPITSPYSRASAKLIKVGAKLVETVEDIIDEFNYR